MVPSTSREEYWNKENGVTVACPLRGDSLAVMISAAFTLMDSCNSISFASILVEAVVL